MMDDFETQLQDLFHEVKTMVASGKNDEASDLLQANYLAVKEQMSAGVIGIEETAILDILALGYTVLGDQMKLTSLLNEVSASDHNLSFGTRFISNGHGLCLFWSFTSG